jgi:Arc/MetJ-type ribon-helix-helix transcriptional regulator
MVIRDVGVTRSTDRATLPSMGRSLHVRLDDASVTALRILRASGLNDSEAVRTALREAAARRRTRAAVEDEARRVAADPDDVEEMRVIREQMAELAPPLDD